jgi:hypothetical protein
MAVADCGGKRKVDLKCSVLWKYSSDDVFIESGGKLLFFICYDSVSVRKEYSICDITAVRIYQFFSKFI